MLGPFVALGAALESTEEFIDDIVFLGCHFADLIVGINTQLIQHAFQFRANAFDLLQVVGLGFGSLAYLVN